MSNLSENTHNPLTSATSQNLAPVVIDNLNNNNSSSQNWSTGFYDCLSDEESCWWGFWCCWLVDARTSDAFQLSTTCNFIFKFWLTIFLWPIITVLFGPVLGIIYLLCAVFYLAYERAIMRTNIRNLLIFFGSFTNDLCLTCCCTSCAVCQSARQAKISRPMRILDLCSGQPLSELEEAHERAVGRLAVSVSDIMIPQNGSIYTHLEAISTTTKLIYSIWGSFGLIFLLSLITNGQAIQLLVIFLVFLQPFLLLYFIYWLPRRQWMPLDMVLKMFAVGFWFTTVQAATFELLLQFFMAVIVKYIFGLDLSLLANAIDDSTDDNKQSSSFSLFSGRLSHTLFGGIIYLFQGNYQNSNYSLFAVSQSGADDAANAENTRSILQDNIILVMGVLLFMSYVVAAGTEETMKHFALRCCQLASPLKDPHTILIYLLAAALGFATAENIEYVFSSGDSIPGTSVVVGEIVVLAVRILMPVHAICSVLQAVNLSKILLPAMLVHGTFDFVLFFIGTIQFVYNIESVLLLVLSFLIPILITIGSIIWAYRSFCQVQSNFENGWQSFQENDDEQL